MLKINHLSKTYNKATVKSLDDLSIEVNDGEIFGFLGPNGAGKSTLIKCITGILSFEHGKIYVNGVDIVKKPVLAKKNIGYVSDNHAVYEQLTGREFVNHIANLYNVKPKDRDARVQKYLDIFKLGFAYDRQIKGYSHGMKQKICVIAALVHNPKVWILDEPLTGLDPQSAYQLKQAMKEHAKAGNCVCFSSHILDVVENMCSRVCIIAKGHLKGVFELEQIKKDGKTLEEVFLSEIEEGQTNQ